MHHLEPSLSVMFIVVETLLTEYPKQAQLEVCNVQQQPAQAAPTGDRRTTKSVPQGEHRGSCKERSWC